MSITLEVQYQIVEALAPLQQLLNLDHLWTSHFDRDKSTDREDLETIRALATRLNQLWDETVTSAERLAVMLEGETDAVEQVFGQFMDADGMPDEFKSVWRDRVSEVGGIKELVVKDLRTLAEEAASEQRALAITIQELESGQQGAGDMQARHLCYAWGAAAIAFGVAGSIPNPFTGVLWYYAMISSASAGAYCGGAFGPSRPRGKVVIDV